MSGLFGHADLTPSDLIAALVLTAAAQQQRRRLRIKSALGEKLDSITEVSSDNNNAGGSQIVSGMQRRPLCVLSKHFFFQGQAGPHHRGVQRQQQCR